MTFQRAVLYLLRWYRLFLGIDIKPLIVIKIRFVCHERMIFTLIISEDYEDVKWGFNLWVFARIIHWHWPCNLSTADILLQILLHYRISLSSTLVVHYLLYPPLELDSGKQNIIITPISTSNCRAIRDTQRLEDEEVAKQKRWKER